MEELIYLAVVVGWFLLNAYKKSQEAKRKRQAESGPEAIDDDQREPAVDMEEMLRELMGVPKEPQPEPAPVPVPQPVRETPRPMVVARPTPRAVRPTAENAAKAASDARNERRAVRAQEAETVVETGQGFDLRQAVIHSAILQRPYN